MNDSEPALFGLSPEVALALLGEELESFVLYFDYTNHRGERAWRRVIPLNIPLRFKRLPYNPSRIVWTIKVWDLDRNAYRDYVMADIHEIREHHPSANMEKNDAAKDNPED